MNHEEFERAYKTFQVKAISREPGYEKDTPALFALKTLIEEKESGRSDLNSAFMPIFTLPIRVDLPPEHILAQNPLKEIYPDVRQDRFLVSNWEWAHLASGNFYLLRKEEDMVVKGEFARIPAYYEEAIGSKKPLILDEGKIERYTPIDIRDFEKMYENPDLFFSYVAKRKKRDLAVKYSFASDEKNNRLVFTKTLLLDFSELPDLGLDRNVHKITPALYRDIELKTGLKADWINQLDASETLARTAYAEVMEGRKIAAQ